MNTKRVKAKTISEGDVLYWEHEAKNGKKYSGTHTIKRVSEIDKTTVNLNFAEGGFGLYQKSNFVNKVIA